MATSTHDLESRILEHLDRESKQCREVEKSVMDLRNTLLSSSQAERVLYEPFRADLMENAKQLSTEREMIKAEIANRLSVPIREASVRLFAAQCDLDKRSQLREACEQLSQAASSLNGLLAANNNFLFRLSSLIGSVLHELTGEMPSSSTYDSNGLRKI